MELKNFLEKAEDYFISHFAVDLLVFAVVIAIIVIIIVRRHKKNEAKKSLNNIISFSSIQAPVEEVPKKPQDPIEDIAGNLGVATSEIRVALAIPINATCSATIADDAWNMFSDADEDSDEAYAALKRWIELEEDLDIMCDDLWNATETFPSLRAELTKKYALLSYREK